jgi:4-amino-4-deoxychorismate lyase
LELIETIKIENGDIENIEYHQKRFDASRKKLFCKITPIDLLNIIVPPISGLYRCRILYDKKIKSIQYLPYRPKTFKNFKIAVSNIDYTFKYSDRSKLEDLKAQYPLFDEIIIEKDGMLTDTTISNIAFFDGEKWITPAKALLKGTMRAKLLDDGFLSEQDIKTEDIKNFKRFALLNAMLGFREIENYYIEN